MLQPARSSLLAVVAYGSLTATALPASAALTFSTIAGKWCTDAGTLDVASNHYFVKPRNSTRAVAYVIHNIQYGADRIVIIWGPNKTSTTFANFSGQTMTQLVTKEAPPRQYKRCG